MKDVYNLSDGQLITLYLEGDNKSIETLIFRHQNKVFTSIYLLVKDKYIADDIFQETFIKAIDTLRSGRYADEGKFLQWVLRISHNLCVDYFRKKSRTPIIRTNDEQDVFEVLKFEEPNAEENLIRREEKEHVKKLLDLIPQDQREVIILRHFANLTFKEIASITDCSINTALGRMRYGLFNLRRLIGEKQVA